MAYGAGDLRTYDLRRELFVVEASMQAHLLCSARLDERAYGNAPGARGILRGRNSSGRVRARRRGLEQAAER